MTLPKIRRRCTIISSLIVLSSTFSIATEYHVSIKGSDTNTGTAAHPLRSIAAAVQYAYPGDVITIHEGTYREWVNPVRGGESDEKRIVYRAAPGEKVEIKGSEVINNWKNLGNGVWKVTVDNELFGNHNPYQDSIYGDWFNRRGRIHHTGEVFLNGKSLYEKESKELVLNPRPWLRAKDQEGSTYTWYCESNVKNTTIWANFHAYDPNKELVEISVRKTCFYPEQPGIDFITISGMHISQAATQWGAPTAEQIGMIATHWNKGWIIENNVISNSKCSGITLGKERGTGHNVWSNDKSIDGSIHYIETTFRTLQHGWQKGKVGSHIVRNNEIFACEQTGMCGSMGAAFSIIENNHIHDIWTKRQFEGAEIGGIKFHAAIDAQIRNNCIHNCGRGLWLDWMTQGTRVSTNLFYNNDREDFFSEVNHGPYLVDNNILLSANSLRIQSQGGAFVHNLIAGGIYMWGTYGRFTPYHFAHSTSIAGLAFIYTGDDRYYNNIIVGMGKKPGKKDRYKPGLADYTETELPVFINDNVYYNEAIVYEKEQNNMVSKSYNPGFRIEEKSEHVYLHMEMDQTFFNHHGKIITTQILGKAKVPGLPFEEPDGTPLSIDTDYFGVRRTRDNNSAGPFNNLERGEVILKIW